MFIQTESTSDPASMRFLPGRQVLPSGTAEFMSRDASQRSPLAERLFGIEGVVAVSLAADSITVRKRSEKEWHVLKPAILGVIMEHFVEHKPVMLGREAEDAAGDGSEVEDPEAATQIDELIATRIRPAAKQDGGDVIFRGLKGGVAYLEFQGQAHQLRAGIERMLRHYVPEVRRVADHREAQPKPGLGKPEAQTIQALLDDRINPAVSAHGGYVALVDVLDDVAYIRLEGGCQGCGMADVTLRQGIEVEIKRAVPAISSVLDVTDHAGGSNPYYQPGKGGASAV
ncbi:MAG: NifU family protein [Alphaproteobacteria bacterium]